MLVPLPSVLSGSQQATWLVVVLRALVVFLVVATAVEAFIECCAFLLVAGETSKIKILGTCHYAWLALIKGCAFMGGIAFAALNLRILSSVYLPFVLGCFVLSSAFAIGDLFLFSQTRRHLYDPLFVAIINNPKLFIRSVSPSFGDLIQVVLLFSALICLYFYIWKLSLVKIAPWCGRIATRRNMLFSLGLFLALLVSLSYLYATLGSVDNEESEIAQCQAHEVLPFYQVLFCSVGMDIHGTNDFRTDAQRKSKPVFRHRKAQAPPRHRPDIVLLLWDSVPDATVTPDVAPHMRQFIGAEANLVAEHYVTSAGSTEISLWSLLYGMHPDSRAILDFDSYKTPSFYIDTLRAIGYDVYWCMTGYSDYWWAYGRHLKYFGEGQFGDRIRTSHRSDVVDMNSDSLTSADILKLITNPRRSRPIFLLGVFGCTHWPYPFLLKEPKFPKAALRSPEGHANAVADGDHIFNNIVQELKRSDLWNKTIFLLSADHGEGVHSTTHRGHMPRTPLGLSSNEQLLLPFGMHIPGYLLEQRNLPTNRVQAFLGSHVDIMPTIFDVLGVDSGPWNDTSQLRYEQEEEHIRGILSGTSLYRKSGKHNWTYSYQVCFPTMTSRMGLLFVTPEFKVHYVTDQVCAFNPCMLRRVFPHEVEHWSDLDGKLLSESQEQKDYSQMMLDHYLKAVEEPLSKLILERRFV